MFCLPWFCFPFNARWYFLTFFAEEHTSSRGRSIRIVVVYSGSSMASSSHPPDWGAVTAKELSPPSFYFWNAGSVCLKHRDMAELWGNLMSSFPSVLERGPFFVHTVRTAVLQHTLLFIYWYRQSTKDYNAIAVYSAQEWPKIQLLPQNVHSLKDWWIQATKRKGMMSQCHSAEQQWPWHNCSLRSLHLLSASEAKQLWY